MLGTAQAAGLQALIDEAVNTDPAVLEARANEEVAASRADATRAQHYPTLGLQTGHYVANQGNHYSQPFRGVAGRVNLYAAGSIDAAVERYRGQEGAPGTRRVSLRAEIFDLPTATGRGSIQKG